MSSQAGNHNEPLRTSHTYDDDEVFLAAARHLLSSRQLPSTRQQRTSFLEGLRVRQKQWDVLAPAVAAAVQALQAHPEIEQTLAAEEGGDTTMHATSSFSVQSIHHQRNQQQQQQHNKPEAAPKRSRRFFPSNSFDGDSIGSGSRISSAFRNNRRRVQNIDLCEAVGQLQLTDARPGHHQNQEQQQQQLYHQHQQQYHPTATTSAAAPGFF